MIGRKLRRSRFSRSTAMCIVSPTLLTLVELLIDRPWTLISGPGMRPRSHAISGKGKRMRRPAALQDPRESKLAPAKPVMNVKSMLHWCIGMRWIDFVGWWKTESRTVP
ncbi:hypothetical protein BDZ85DRAFT_259797 [Elsinoe ampelina]|uniref:Uncharacterized protein n=1 Tax=Elsinoe ampelina TaxID=302913 RepID=A0A6A6GHI3_9PEZI|nr:hypothetical protein BDZ85DRAFT_259797 [Elsinoe ampelina]